MYAPSPLGVALLAAASILATGCGSASPTGSPPPGYTVTISTLAFSPANLAVPAGATVTVVNRDSMPHSVTEEATAGAFTLGGPTGTTPFDTGLFVGTATFVVPTAPEGPVLPYYCKSHTTLMIPANPTLTITAAAPPTGGGGGGGGGY